MKTREIKKEIVERTEYVAEDGTVFYSVEDCEYYEHSALFTVTRKLKRIEGFISCNAIFNGREESNDLVEVFDMLFGGEQIVKNDAIIAQPTDPYGYFTNYADAELAANEAAAAGSLNTHNYYGQTLTVVNNNSARLYIIQPDATLAQVAILQDIPVPIDTYSKIEIDNREHQNSR